LQKVTANDVVNHGKEIEICGFTSTVDYTEWKNSIAVTIKDDKADIISPVQSSNKNQKIIEKIRQ